MATRKKPAARKPAIQTRQGHPQGITDDILLPVAKTVLSIVRKPIQKGYAKKVSKIPKNMSPYQAGITKSKTSKALDKIDNSMDAIDAKRSKIYASKRKATTAKSGKKVVKGK